MRSRALALWCLAGVAASASCRSTAHAPGGGGAAGAADDVVAEAGRTPIRRADLVAEMRRGGKTARDALADLINFELLAVEAARVVADDPDVEDARRQASVQRMVERELEPKLARDAIPDAVLRELYNQAHRAFVHPRLVEVALLSIYTGARMKAEPRARSLEAARALEAALRARAATTTEDFAAIAEEPTWRERRVKFARIWQGFDEPFSAEVGRAVATLRRPGDTTPLVTAESGYHIARYISERPPESVTFEEARDRLRDQIAERWRQVQFLEYTQAAASSHTIEAFPERLAFGPAPPGD